MKFKKLDLNLLVALDALLAERNVTRAGERLFLSQSAMSHALARLREYFDDPLIIRVGNEMQLTHRAEALIGPLRETLARIEVSLDTLSHFTPVEARNNFFIAATEYCAQMLLPQLARRLQELAPNMRLTVLNYQPNDDLGLEAGRTHLVITKPLTLDSGLASCPLFEDEWVGVVSAKHPLFGTTPNFQQFIAGSHMIFLAGDNAFAEHAMEITLGQRGVVRHAPLTVEGLHYVPALLEQTTLIAVLPKRVCESAAKLTEISCFELPFDMPKMQPTMYWHRARTPDLAHAWLRQQLIEIGADIQAQEPVLPRARQHEAREPAATG